jgi:hypothetical protein
MPPRRTTAGRRASAIEHAVRPLVEHVVARQGDDVEPGIGDGVEVARRDGRSGDVDHADLAPLGVRPLQVADDEVRTGQDLP